MDKYAIFSAVSQHIASSPVVAQSGKKCCRGLPTQLTLKGRTLKGRTLKGALGGGGRSGMF